MFLYMFMVRRGWPRTYLGKILLVSFIGVHIPMIGAVAFALLLSDVPMADQWPILVALLAATLVGTVATMLSLGALLSPMRRATHAINAYLREKKTPRLPSQIKDEAGVLMASIQEGITRLDAALTTAELHRDEMKDGHAQKFQVISGMSHDIRTPLNHILGFATMMKAEAMGPLGQDCYRQYASTIDESGRELLDTLQSVLDLSQAESAPFRADELAHVDLAEVADEAIGLEHLNAETKGVSVRQAGAPVAEAHSDRATVKQSISVMLQVAIDTSMAGDTVEIALGCRPNGGGAEVQVTDAGRHFWLEDVPPEMRGRIAGLKPYAASGTAEDGGIVSTSRTAVRLSLLATLAQLVGASLDIRHRDGVGKVVSLTLPESRSGALKAAA